ncbi:MAG: hypothetical protein ACI82Q_001293 [Nonlabens sp.]|jgi:hypothetical protein
MKKKNIYVIAIVLLGLTLWPFPSNSRDLLGSFTLCYEEDTSGTANGGFYLCTTDGCEWKDDIARKKKSKSCDVPF